MTGDRVDPSSYPEWDAEFRDSVFEAKLHAESSLEGYHPAVQLEVLRQMYDRRVSNWIYRSYAADHDSGDADG
jgi:hypothetical protein